MENLLTDQDDPEKRIADMEHQLAEQQRGADLPPAGPHDAATSRRFVASSAPPTTKQMMKYTYVFMFAGMALLGAGQGVLLLVGASLDSDIIFQVGGAALFFTFLLLALPSYAAFQRRINREKKVLVCVTSDGLTVDARPGDVFPFGDAQLGRWTIAGYGGTTKGTALHLRSGRHRFVLGGQDHRIATGTPLDASPVDGVDAWVWAAEFAELLTMAGRRFDVPAPPTGATDSLSANPEPREIVFILVFWDVQKHRNGTETECQPVTTEPGHRCGRRCDFGGRAEEQCAYCLSLACAGDRDPGSTLTFGSVRGYAYDARPGRGRSQIGTTDHRLS
jgi:hypothetical protein